MLETGSRIDSDAYRDYPTLVKKSSQSNIKAWLVARLVLCLFGFVSGSWWEEKGEFSHLRFEVSAI